MKKLLALLLVLCMVLGMVACAKPGDSAGSTGSTETTETEDTTPIRDDISVVDEADLVLKTDDVDSNAAYINPDKFGGKTLHLAGIDSDTYEDIENFGEKGDFLWMMRAAIADWAALNNVNIEFVANYDSKSILAAVNAGDTVDMVLYANAFPQLQNLGITRAFTADEMSVLNKIVGEGWMSMMTYKDGVYGVELPWGGNHWYYYNRTMYENYGVKSPKEYYLEGNWTYDTMEACHESVTKDNNGNGKIDENDTYGISSVYMTSFMAWPYEVSEGADGKLTDITGTSPEYRRILEMSYKGQTETLSVLKGQFTNKTSTNPRPSAQFSDAEWYNFEHLYDVMDNGDVIECLPTPVFSTEQPTRVTNHTVRYMAMANSCDEQEAAFALFCYILKVGMRYISDYSVGLYDCTYEGIQGASDFSKAWKKEFKRVLADRRRAFIEIEDWDQETYIKMVQDVFAADTKQYVARAYEGKPRDTNNYDGLPAASVLAKISEYQSGWINKYNSLYAN